MSVSTWEPCPRQSIQIVPTTEAFAPCESRSLLALWGVSRPSDRSLFVSLAALCLLGCGGAGEFRRTGGAYAARGPGCDYRVIRNRIVEPYEEIGVVDIDAFSVPQLPSNEDEFRSVVGKYVCASGGHAVVPAVNMQGRWVSGTVIRFRPAECDRCRDGSIMRGPEAGVGTIREGDG